MATAGSSSKSATLQLNAATPALTLNASTVSFGAVVVNSSTTQTVTLTSTGTAAVTINSVSITGTGFSLSSVSLPAKLNPGQALSLTLTFSPAAVGSSTGQLAISSTSSTNPNVTIGLSGTANPHEVELAWSPPSSSGVTIAGYKVYRAISGSGGFAALSSASTQTSYTDTGIQSGKAYDYYVTSVDSAGAESVPSNTTTVTVP
ncbi:MAG TPA: choice-of-anchor D domain-containing protein [Terracidiphilus sp.]|nr:choice-of-anchor D domain-containing protein [Terracidiphilus sp.]